MLRGWTMPSGSPIRISAPFFFPQQWPLDAPRVNLDEELSLCKLGQLREAQRWLRFLLRHEEGHYCRRKFVAALRTALQRCQPRQSGFGKTELGLIEGGAGEPKLPCSLRNRLVVDMDLPEHLVLDLNHVVGIEKVAALEQRMVHILRTRVERAGLL